MTAWNVIRIIWTIFSFPFAVVVGLNIERIAEAHRLDQLVPDPAVGGFQALIQTPWVVATSIFLVGTVVGIWAHSLFKGILTARLPSKKDRLQSLGYKMQILAAEIQNGSFTMSHEAEYRRAVLNSNINKVLTAAMREGLSIPDDSIGASKLMHYLTAVGGWLVDGEEAAARQAADQLHK